MRNKIRIRDRLREEEEEKELSNELERIEKVETFKSDKKRKIIPCSI